MRGKPFKVIHNMIALLLNYVTVMYDRRLAGLFPAITQLITDIKSTGLMTAELASNLQQAKISMHGYPRTQPTQEGSSKQ